MVNTSNQLQMYTCLSAPIPHTKYIVPLHPNKYDSNFLYNINLGYSKHEIELTTSTTT